MPSFFKWIREGTSAKNAERLNRFEGFTEEGAVVLRDGRGTRKAEIPDVSEKGFLGGDNPLAIYKPSTTKQVDAAKAMANFTGWTYAAVNAIASEVASIDLRLYEINGKNHDEVEDHELLDLLDSVNPSMTGIELKYVALAHLELTGNAYWYLDGVRARGRPHA